MLSSTLIKYILRNVAKRKARSLVIILTLAMSVASLMGGVSASESMSRSLRASLDEAHAADVMILTKPVPADTLVGLSSADPCISEVELRLLVHSGVTVGSFNGNANLFGLAGEPQINKSFLADGRWFDDINAPEVVLERSLAETSGVRVGDAIVVSIQSRTAVLTVVGIARDAQVAMMGLGKPTLWMPLGTLQRLFDLDGKVNLVYLIGKQNEDTDAIAQSAQDFLSSQNVFVESLFTHSLITSMAQQIVRFGAFFSLLVAVLMLIIASLIILNTLGRALIESRRELALMKAMGALDRKLVGLTIIHAALYGVFGTGVGIPLGILLTRLLVSGYTRLIQATHVVTVVSTVALSLSAITGLGLPIFLAVLSSHFKHRIDLRFVLNPFPDIVIPSVPRRSVGQGHVVWRYITRTLSRGRIGTIVITAAVALAVGIFAGLRGFLDGLEELFISANSLSNHDFQIEFHEPVPHGIVETIGMIEGVVRAEPQINVYEQEVRALTSPKTLKVEVVGVPSDSQIKTFAFYAGENFSSGELPEILISTRVARELGLNLGDEITITNFNRAIQVKVRGIVIDINNMGQVVYVPLSLVQALTANEGLISRVLVQVQDSIRPQVAQTLQEQYGGIAALYTREYWLETSLNQLGLMNIFISVVVALMLLVVLIGLVDAITIRALERRNEIAILRALGGTRGQVAAIILGEQLLIGLIGGILAAGIGYGLTIAMTEWISHSYFDIPLVLSPTWAIVSLLLSGVTCLIGGSIPLGHALRIRPAGLLHRHIV